MLVVFQDLQIRLFVQSVRGIYLCHLELALHNGRILEADVDGLVALELQTVELRERSVLHRAFRREELMLRAEGQLARDLFQIAYFFKTVLLRDILRHCDRVRVVESHLAEQGHVVLFLPFAVREIVERLAFRHIGRVEVEEGRQERSVVTDHQVAAVILPGHRLEVVDLRHLVLYHDRSIRIGLDQHLRHVMHKLRLGVVALIEHDLLRLPL